MGRGGHPREGGQEDGRREEVDVGRRNASRVEVVVDLDLRAQFRPCF